MKDSVNKDTYQSLEERIVQCNKEIEECNKRLDEAIEKCQRYKEYIKDVEKKVDVIGSIMIGIIALAITYFVLEVL